MTAYDKLDFEELKKLDETYIMPTYARFPLAIESGAGAVARSTGGREYIDFTSGIGVNSLGFADAGLTDAVKAQAEKLLHHSNLYISPAQIRLAELLRGASGLDRVFFCSSGAEANECAIKLARKYSADKYGGGRSDIITLRNSFHGRTVTTLSATGQETLHKHFFPFTEGFFYAEPNNIEDMEEKITPSVCAVLIEPVQGEGGVVPLNIEYLTAVRELCDKNDILMMLDEVQTGIGRTGSFYAFQQMGITPDVVTSAKGLAGGLPLGACLVKKELGEVFAPGDHGATFGGNPLACAAAAYVVETVTAPGFLKAVTQKGWYLRAKLKQLPLVREVRGKGLMIGLTLDEIDSKTAARACHENGLMILTAKALLRLLPPLNITQEEMDRGLAILGDVLLALEKNKGEDTL
ncbi:MAG TPA: aspartate aminotransferase family protein [Ruminococcaceae bacterium]|nr:aspartate aminotransferase family protein [Oscillospiraceae bacterium]